MAVARSSAVGRCWRNFASIPGKSWSRLLAFADKAIQSEVHDGHDAFGLVQARVVGRTARRSDLCFELLLTTEKEGALIF
jgi:hypothetical protein